MKKILLATTLLAATTVAATAEVKLSGYGRIGAVYFDADSTSPYFDPANPNPPKTQLSSRLRINVDVSATADTGFEIGGRVRLQADQGRNDAAPSAASFYVTSGPFRLDAGNISDAIDNMATIYNSEVGFLGSSSGDPGNDEAIPVVGFASHPFSDAAKNQVGVQASYSAAGLTGRVSYHKADQTVKNGADHIAVSVDYKTGALQLGAGYSTFSPSDADAADGVQDSNNYILSAEYDAGFATVGAIYQDGDYFDNGDALVSIYAAKSFGSLEIRGYVASGGAVVGGVKPEDTAVGVGATQDLGGGVSLSGSVQHTVFGDNAADVGVKFSF
jgi:outer membrane protein OmpU